MCTVESIGIRPAGCLVYLQHVYMLLGLARTDTGVWIFDCPNQKSIAPGYRTGDLSRPATTPALRMIMAHYQNCQLKLLTFDVFGVEK